MKKFNWESAFLKPSMSGPNSPLKCFVALSHTRSESTVLMMMSRSSALMRRGGARVLVMEILIIRNLIIRNKFSHVYKEKVWRSFNFIFLKLSELNTIYLI